MYVQRGEEDKAARCFHENLQRLDRENLHTNETVEALRYLASFYRSKGEGQKAH